LPPRTSKALEFKHRRIQNTTQVSKDKVDVTEILLVHTNTSIHPMSVRKTTPSAVNCQLVLCPSRFNQVLAISDSVRENNKRKQQEQQPQRTNDASHPASTNNSKFQRVVQSFQWPTEAQTTKMKELRESLSKLKHESFRMYADGDPSGLRALSRDLSEAEKSDHSISRYAAPMRIMELEALVTAQEEVYMNELQAFLGSNNRSDHIKNKRYMTLEEQDYERNWANERLAEVQAEIKARRKART
jgi:hypothetical protein